MMIYIFRVPGFLWGSFGFVLSGEFTQCCSCLNLKMLEDVWSLNPGELRFKYVMPRGKTGQPKREGGEREAVFTEIERLHKIII